LVQSDSFVALADSADLVRHILSVAVRWWPLLPAKAELPQSVAALEHCIQQLPFDTLASTAKQLFGG